MNVRLLHPSIENDIHRRGEDDDVGADRSLQRSATIDFDDARLGMSAACGKTYRPANETRPDDGERHRIETRRRTRNDASPPKTRSRAASVPTRGAPQARGKCYDQ